MGNVYCSCVSIGSVQQRHFLKQGMMGNVVDLILKKMASLHRWPFSIRHSTRLIKISQPWIIDITVLFQCNQNCIFKPIDMQNVFLLRLLYSNLQYLKFAKCCIVTHFIGKNSNFTTFYRKPCLSSNFVNGFSFCRFLTITGRGERGTIRFSSCK